MHMPSCVSLRNPVRGILVNRILRCHPDNQQQTITLVVPLSHPVPSIAHTHQRIHSDARGILFPLTFRYLVPLCATYRRKCFCNYILCDGPLRQTGFDPRADNRHESIAHVVIRISWSRRHYQCHGYVTNNIVVYHFNIHPSISICDIHLLCRSTIRSLTIKS